jgi:hypothetical protein
MRFVLLFISFIFSIASIAQHPLAYDSAEIKARSFDSSAINAYKKDRQFQYDKMQEPVQSLWDRFWRWFWNMIDQLLSTKSGQRTFYVILIIVFIALVVLFIIKMTGNRSGLFGSKGKDLDYEIGEEDIHHIAFEDAIRQAIDSGNYRLAVRLVYLHSLKLLSDKMLIDWRPGKTNSAYIYELKDHPAYRSFNQLTMEFEYAWYGGEAVSKEHYQEFDDSFKEFKNHLSK